jgi:murein DD-endopeptidase MepM/ murein hydrolase activator NlpD
LKFQISNFKLLRLIACLAAAFAAAAAGPAARPLITLSSAEVETGGTLIVTVDCRGLKAASREPALAFGGQPVPLFRHPGRPPGVFAGVVGIAAAAAPGPASAVVSWGEGAARQTATVEVAVRPAVFGEDTLTVDPRHVRPSPRDLERIRREQAEVRQVYASGSRARLWKEAFQVPVPGEMHGPFGTRRVFNGELQSQHNGADYRAQTGDPIRAAAAGVVRLAKDLFYSGNAVIVDHGAGVFTSYSHLSRIDVTPGQTVARGAVIGLAGATGRVTGPHLHWTVRVGAANVDPVRFLEAMRGLGGA